MTTLATDAALEAPTLRGLPLAWATAWQSTRFRWMTLLSAIALPGSLALLARYLEWVETRPGVVLPDPLLELLSPPLDLTWITFSLIYVAIFCTVVRLSRNPPSLLFGMQAYALMALLRMFAMSLVPLDAPPGMIALVDPMVQTLGTGKALTKDLFFSGHTATLYLLFLLEDERRAKVIYLLGTIGIAVCVLWQHVHYSVDVMAAPLFADLAYRIAKKMRLY